MTITPIHCRAESIGSEAWRLLAGPGSSGKVLAAVSKTIYLQSNSGEILWVVKASLPMHRRSLRTSFPTLPFDPGNRFFVQESCLHMGEQATIHLDEARHWNRRKVERGDVVSPAFLAALVRKTLADLCGLASPKGFGQALPVVSAIALDKAIPPVAPDFMLGEALDSIIEAAEACLAKDLPRAVRTSRELVGLGAGLTPSGDDFLGGLLFTAHALQESYPQHVHWDRETLPDSIRQVREQTNSISHTLLTDLAFGYGPESLHDLVNAFIMGKEMETIMKHIIRMTEIGSTSGWDMLTGLMTGVLLMDGSTNGFRQS